MNKLQCLCLERGAIRAGSTGDPNQRKYGYEAEGYSGTLFYARVSDMKQAEDDLLRRRDFLHNIHSRSNSQPQKGYVYIIKGRCWQQ